MRNLKHCLLLSIISLLSFSNVVESTKCVVRNHKTNTVTPKISTPKKSNIKHVSIEENIKNDKSFDYDKSIYDKNDKYYLVYVNNTYTDGLTKRQEPNQFVNSIVQEINNLIIDNKKTFKNPDKLEALVEDFHPLRKRNQNSENTESNLVFEIASVNDISVLLSYISYGIKDMVKSIPGVRNVEPDRKLNLQIPYDVIDLDPKEKVKRYYEDDEDEYYSDVKPDDNNVDIEAIKKETGWDGVEIRNRTDLHLSLISQDKFNLYSFEQYDNNYYYPKSAGEGIDVYVLDGDFNFNHPEYENADDREVKILGIFRNGTLTQADDYALPTNPHGEIIADAIGGLKHGVAPKANIYGMAIEFDLVEDDVTSISKASFIKTLEYIRKNIKMKPHKSVMNISLGQYFLEDEDAETIKFMEENFKKLDEMGIVVVVASGNDKNAVRTEFEGKKYINYPCASKNVICVGGIDNYGYFTNSRLTLRMAKKMKYMEPDNYIRARFSNYGDEVDILAPGFVHLEFVGPEDEMKDSIFIGTSFSSPIVAGVAASIMAEHPEIKFNSSSMNAYLTDLAVKDIIEDAKGPNVFINNGKKTQYLHPEFVYDFPFEYDYSSAISFEEEVTTFYEYETITVPFEEYTDPSEEVTSFYEDFNGVNNNNYKAIKNEEEDDTEIVTEYITQYVDDVEESDEDSEEVDVNVELVDEEDSDDDSDEE